jgi:hypothetical protein
MQCGRIFDAAIKLQPAVSYFILLFFQASALLTSSPYQRIEEYVYEYRFARADARNSRYPVPVENCCGPERLLADNSTSLTCFIHSRVVGP